MKKYHSYFLFPLFILTVPLQCTTMQLDFIDPQFEDFMKRMQVPAHDRIDFKVYYAKLLANVRKGGSSTRRTLQAHLYQMALTALEKEHPLWHESLKPFITDPRITLDTEINDIRECIGGFLIRYAAYHEFYSKRYPAPTWALLGQVKSFSYKISDTICGWFRGKPINITV